MPREPNDRLTELEVQLAHVQRLYEQLNEVVTAQAMENDRISRQLIRLQRQLKEMKQPEESSFDPLDEKPPHY